MTSTALGVTAALALVSLSLSSAKIHLGLLLAPLVMPDILMGISCFFFRLHPSEAQPSYCLLAHTTFSMSYVAMIVRTRLETMDISIIEAAKDLGATTFQVFWKVILPILAPAIMAGGLLAFTLSLDDFRHHLLCGRPGSDGRFPSSL